MPRSPRRPSSTFMTATGSISLKTGKFRRAEVKGGKTLPGNLQQVTGITPGQKVVVNALALQATAQQ